MKTIREWLSEGLTAEHYELISKYDPLYDWDTKITSSLSRALIGSTSWGRTEEGHDFWHSIYEEICQNGYIKHSNNIFLKL